MGSCFVRPPSMMPRGEKIADGSTLAFRGELLFGITVALAPRQARAEETSDKAAAEALYQLAQQLMTAGDYGSACPKLEASNSLDPGVGTLLLLGDCQEKLGKLASAWAAFREAAQLASSRNDTERARVAEVRAAALKPRLVHVVYKVAAGDDVPGFELRQSGALISKGSWGVPLPLESGPVRARSQRAQSRKLALGARGSREARSAVGRACAACCALCPARQARKLRRSHPA